MQETKFGRGYAILKQKLHLFHKKIAASEKCLDDKWKNKSALASAKLSFCYF